MCEVFRRKGLRLCTDTHGERFLKHIVCYVGTEGVRNDTQLRLKYPAKDTADGDIWRQARPIEARVSDTVISATSTGRLLCIEVLVNLRRGRLSFWYYLGALSILLFRSGLPARVLTL